MRKILKGHRKQRQKSALACSGDVTRMASSDGVTRMESSLEQLTGHQNMRDKTNAMFAKRNKTLTGKLKQQSLPGTYLCTRAHISMPALPQRWSDDNFRRSLALTSLLHERCRPRGQHRRGQRYSFTRSVEWHRLSLR